MSKDDHIVGPFRLVVYALLAASALLAAGVSPWRSALYPEDWTPACTDAEGRFLHDFSYAGYRNGESEPVLDSALTVFDAGTDTTGATDATAAIQAAIDAASAAGGGIVHLPEGLYRCDGVLTVNTSRVVLQGAGSDMTRLYFTSVEGMSDKNHLSFMGHVQRDGDWPLVRDGENRSSTVYVADASGLEVGDDVALGWVISEAFVAEHGMQAHWQAFNGTWQVIFRRTVMAVDRTVSPNAVTLDVPLRYPAQVRDGASLRKEQGYLRECGIEGLSVSNAGDWKAAWNEMRVHAIGFSDADNCWIRDVRSFASPDVEGGYHLQNGGMKLMGCKRMTVADCRMGYAQNRGSGGCGYLFEISQSSEILICGCEGIAGRHNFIQNWGFGASGLVFSRCHSAEGRAYPSRDAFFAPAGLSEYHHSLAMACLVDQCVLDDGWYGGNRRDWSSGAGHTVTQSVFWNTRGAGILLSGQYVWGYIIGTQGVSMITQPLLPLLADSAPEDWAEGVGRAETLEPASLYEDQRQRRLGRRMP